jgi:hypothetical protein
MEPEHFAPLSPHFNVDTMAQYHSYIYYNAEPNLQMAAEAWCLF